jgi:endogenous inhibitor of DNA gyrase (YacG/DUF329 family)
MDLQGWLHEEHRLPIPREEEEQEESVKDEGEDEE